MVADHALHDTLRKQLEVRMESKRHCVASHKYV